MPGEKRGTTGMPNAVDTTHDNSNTGDDPERSRLVLDLTRLDELTPDDEEEISRFRSFAAASTGGPGHRLGRMFGHRHPAPGRAAS